MEIAERDGDFVSDGELSSDKYEYLQYNEYLSSDPMKANKYHPTVKDFSPPKIKVTATYVYLPQKKTTEKTLTDTDVSYSFLGCYFSVHFKVSDPAGVDNVASYLVNTEQIGEMEYVSGTSWYAWWDIPITKAFYGSDFDFVSYIYASDVHGNPNIETATFYGVLRNGSKVIEIEETKTDYSITRAISDGARAVLNTVISIGGQIWDSVVDFVSYCGQVVTEAATAAINAVVDALNAVIQWLLDVLWPMIKAAIEFVLSPIISPIKSAIDNFIRTIGNCGMTVLDTLTTLGIDLCEISDRVASGSATDEAVLLFDKITGGLLSKLTPFTNCLNTIISIINPVLDAIKDVVDRTIDLLIDAIESIVGGNPVTNAIGSIKDAALSGNYIGIVDAIIEHLGLSLEGDPEEVPNWEEWTFNANIAMTAFVLSTFGMLLSAVLFTPGTLPLIGVIISFVGYIMSAWGAYRYIEDWEKNSIHSDDAFETFLTFGGWVVSGIGIALTVKSTSPPLLKGIEMALATGCFGLASGAALIYAY